MSARKPSRRVLLGAGAVGVAAAAASPFALPSTESYVRRLLEAEFGTAIVEQPDTRRFIADVAARLSREPDKAWKHRIAAVLSVVGIARGHAEFVRGHVLTLFLNRTNGYRVWRGLDAKLVYVSLDPYETGCGNALVSANRPTGYLNV